MGLRKQRRPKGKRTRKQQGKPKKAEKKAAKGGAKETNTEFERSDIQIESPFST
jgi:hypothetical protein